MPSPPPLQEPPSTISSVQRAHDIERVFIALVATGSLAIPVAQCLATLVRIWLPGAAPLNAADLSWTVVLVSVLFATAQWRIRRSRALPWVGIGLAVLGAAGLWLRCSGPLAVSTAALVMGVLQTAGASWIAGHLPDSVVGASRRHPARRVLWGLLGVVLLIQSGRLGTYMADPSSDWWLTTRNELWAKHMCLPAYLEAEDLRRQGIANVYDTSYYLALTRNAQPHLTMTNMDLFAGDPFQYPPQFLLLPFLALGLTHDFLAIRTIWYAMQVLLFAGVAFRLATWVGKESGWAPALLIPLVWLSVPGTQCFQFGQFHVVAIALAIAGMLAFEHRRNALGGVLLAAAILSKIFPGILVVLLVAQRRWKALGWTVGFAGGFSLLALGVLGPGPFSAFINYQLPRMANGDAFAFVKAWPEWRDWLLADNLSPLGLVQKLELMGLPGMSPELGRLLLRVYALLVVGVAILAARSKTDRWQRAGAWLAVLNLAALASPNAWADYVPIGSLWLLTLLPAARYRHRGWAALLAGCWIFAGLLPGVVPMPGFLPFTLMLLLSSFGSVLLVALNTLVVVQASRQRLPAPG